MDDGLYRGPISTLNSSLGLSMRRHPWLDPSDAHPLGDLARSGATIAADYRADAAGQNVVAAGARRGRLGPATPLEETRWRSRWTSGRLPQPLRSLRGAGSRRPEAAVAAQAGYDRVVGVRARLSWHADPANGSPRAPI